MTHSRVVLIVVLTAAGYLSVAAPAHLHSNSSQGPRIEAQPTNCETHIAILDVAHKDAGPAGVIIMIGRPGTGEQSKELTQHRLYSARAYLTEYHGVRSPDMIVVAEGEHVQGYGRIELYIGGKLHTVFALRRNAELSVGSCEPEELDDPRQRKLRKKLYPWRYRNRGL
jgi:hypothetical protein